jgi:hypothetical protein
MPEESLRGPEYPEHALSQPAHHNMDPILASYVSRPQFPYQTLPGNPFLVPYTLFTVP